MRTRPSVSSVAVWSERASWSDPAGAKVAARESYSPADAGIPYRIAPRR